MLVLYQDLEQEKERMMEIQEESRKKLARDLHDGPTQSIAAIAMRVNFARRLMERDPKATLEELYKIEDLSAPYNQRNSPYAVYIASPGLGISRPCANVELDGGKDERNLQSKRNY